MPPLRLPSTAGARPHFDVKPANDRHPHDVFLVLRLGVLQDNRTVTVWAVGGKRYMDLFIHPAGNRSPSPPPVGGAGLASRRLGVRLRLSLGKWRGTSLVGPQRFFQFLSQSLDLRQRASQLLLQRLDSPLEFFLLPIRGAIALRRLHPFDDDTSLQICPAPCLIGPYLLSCSLVNIVD